MLIYHITEDQNIKISDEKFKDLINPDLQEIIEALQSNGYQVRIVGGAVRDILLGDQPRDIDLITDASPDEVIYTLSEHDIKADVWGIKHGTVKAVIKKIKYEITSLDFEINKRPEGGINIKSGGTWQEDAKRRDFTVNSMSMDLNGQVYDYMNGIEDLKNQIVKPNPGFEQKIIKDPVVILRFFKMLAKLPNPKCSKETLRIVKRHEDLLNELQSKRIRKELGNIRKSINAKKTIAIMKKLGIFSILANRTKTTKM